MVRGTILIILEETDWGRLSRSLHYRNEAPAYHDDFSGLDVSDGLDEPPVDLVLMDGKREAVGPALAVVVVAGVVLEDVFYFCFVTMKALLLGPN